MQIVVASRKQFYDAVEFESSPPVDVSGMPVVVVTVTVHALSGTSPQLVAQLQTSDDLETWEDAGTSVTATATGWSASAAQVTSNPYGRYVRVQYQVTGTDPLVNATVVLNTYASS